MKYQTIADVYEGNDHVRAKLKQVVADLSESELQARPEGEEWSIAEIVEHVAIVEGGMMRICGKLLRKAQEKGAAAAAGGAVKLSETFLEKSAGARETKFQAPEMVRPTGTMSIEESLARLDENRARLKELQPLFESLDCADFKFPHPAFGDITAHDWLALVGGHEARHIAQIQKILEKIR